MKILVIGDLVGESGLKKPQAMIKKQINDMPTWSVESISVNGSNGQNRTYSWPKQVTYVMYPTQSTIDTAKSKIADTLRATE